MRVEMCDFSEKGGLRERFPGNLHPIALPREAGEGNGPQIYFGSITLLITWMTPLLCMTS